MSQTTKVTESIGKALRNRVFMDRHSLLNCLLTGNGKQITILTGESWRKQSFVTYENFVMVNEERGEQNLMDIWEQGYEYSFNVGDVTFLAKTYICYVKYLAVGDALDSDVETIPVTVPTWVLEDVAGEIRADWEKQVVLQMQFMNRWMR